MARKKQTKMMKKTAMNRSATSRRLSYFVEEGVVNYIDIAAGLSLVNQRAYSQGRNYVAKVTLEPGVDLTGIGGAKTANERLLDLQCNFTTLPNQWQLHQAWQLAKDAWMRSMREEVESGIVTAKYQDFAVAYDESHVGYDTNATPAVTNWARGALPFLQSHTGAPIEPNNGAVPANTDLVFSRSVSLGGGTTTRRFVVFGNSGSNFNILTELDKARSVVRNKVDPVASAAGAPYGALITDLDATTADYIEDDGDSAPYLIDSHRLGLSIHTLHAFPQKGIHRLSSGYMDVPLGIMQLQVNELAFSDDGTNEQLPAGYWVHIDVKEGSYKGVEAPPMGV